MAELCVRQELCEMKTEQKHGMDDRTKEKAAPAGAANSNIRFPDLEWQGQAG